jgi:hypothetical protein
MIVPRFFLRCGSASAQAEKRKKEHDHDDQAHEIDDAMHRRLLKTGDAGSLRVVARPALQEPVADEKVPCLVPLRARSRIVFRAERIDCTMNGGIACRSEAPDC